MNNPIMLVDFDGRSVDKIDDIEIGKLLKSEKGRETVNKMKTDLQKMSGLSFIERVDGDKVFLEIDKNVDIKMEGTSKTLRNDLTYAIEGTNKVISVNATKGDTRAGAYNIFLNSKNIQNQVKGVNNLNSKTLGYGLSFYHELTHTIVGFDKQSYTSEPKTIDRVNKVRSELGNDYGIRQSHKLSFPVKHNNKFFMFHSFDKAFYKAVNDFTGSGVPESNSKFIKIPANF